MKRHDKTINMIQYNVNKSQDLVMHALNKTMHPDKYHIIAIQELWRNPKKTRKPHRVRSHKIPGSNQCQKAADLKAYEDWLDHSKIAKVGYTVPTTLRRSYLLITSSHRQFLLTLPTLRAIHIHPSSLPHKRLQQKKLPVFSIVSHLTRLVGLTVFRIDSSANVEQP